MNAISNLNLKRSTWQIAMLLTLGFWLSASLVLDWVIMPSLAVAGMMNEANFSTAGYVVFWNFNRLELLSAAVVLTAVLAISKTKSNWPLGSIALSGLLIIIVFLDTYFLTPQMCALGANFSLLARDAMPPAMNLLHSGYFLLEALKVVGGGVLLNWCWREA
ncbi:hypothetical protein IQ226_14205 [Dolichospermum sp. LEGE 00240]|jgi:hypothetical protein|uniref:hypothetical protein n=1 Tax=Dolichospermum sp. LEGE 00240 TaxID=1828603 RepID=UPI0018812E4C|nr:hypothetical protein [Dolichospermum sp. LEGE 00240]MDM3844283.1 hypothetical protein [Aphanizomenon gracile PMC638.10]MDM3851773.1 hypothetical protein [Aphanizomenon gracile PMC627.10]MDM3856517.1 hypothetical protein [Aphanizomenon gracile PMC649.10]MDM3860335.1 hypothetical protein [Aphanizomenon gracile PMC644.10]MBE9250281.1 hypothetical protein [Dolichospermum sp. LEGE 00240]